MSTSVSVPAVGRRPVSAAAGKPGPRGGGAAAARTLGSARGIHGVEPEEGMRRRLRQLEQNHRDWQEEVQRDLRRQKITIETLRRDNEPLLQRANELRLSEATAKDGAMGSKSLKASKKLEAQKEQLSKLQAAAEAQRTRNDRVRRDIEEARRQLKGARKDMGGVRVNEEAHAAVGQQVRILENRLDQSLQRFNEVLRVNKGLRDQIDALRSEREVFDDIYMKLEAELQEKKKEMAFIIEVSNIAYEERDNNVQVLSNLKLFAAEEMASFAETFKELDELLEEDRQVKEHVRTRLTQLEKQERLREEERSAAAASGKGRGGGAAQAAQEEDRAGAGGPTEAQQHEEAFNKIRQATDIPDLDALVQRFLRSEEDNFSLFSYVNDLGKEIEVLEAQRAALLKDIDRAALGDDADQQRRDALGQLEGRLLKEEQQCRAAKERATHTESLLRSVTTTVDPLFARLECDDAPVVDAHGVPGLSLESLLTYLACIEARAEEYVRAWARQGAGADGGALQVARGPQVPFDAMQVIVDPKRLPGTGEDADGSDDDARPLTRDQLLAKAKANMVGGHGSAAHTARQVRGKRPGQGLKKPIL